MKRTGKCPKCGSTEIMADAKAIKWPMWHVVNSLVSAAIRMFVSSSNPWKR